MNNIDGQSRKFGEHTTHRVYPPTFCAGHLQYVPYGAQSVQPRVATTGSAERGFRGMFCCDVSRSVSAAGLGVPPMVAASGSSPSVTALRDQGGWCADPRRGASIITGTEVNSA